jgi:hypothetical protein
MVFALSTGAVLAAHEVRVESRDRSIVAVVTHTGSAASYPERNAWSASVFTRNGGMIYSVSMEIPYDIPFPAVYLSDTGEAIVVQAFDGVIDYYDRRGSRTASLHPFGSSEPLHEQIVRCSVSGGRAAFLVSSPLRQNALLFITDLSGNELWQMTMADQFAGEVFLSQDAGVVCACTYSSTREISRNTAITDGAGSVLRTIPALFRHADVSPDNRFFALSDRNSVLIGKVQGEPQEPARWSTEERSRVITSVMFINGVVAASVDSVDMSEGFPTYRSPELVVVDSSAAVLRRQSLVGSSEIPSWLTAGNDSITLQSGTSSVSIPVRDLRTPR